MAILQDDENDVNESKEWYNTHWGRTIKLNEANRVNNMNGPVVKTTK